MKKKYPRHTVNLNKEILLTAFKMLLGRQAVEGGQVAAFEQAFAEFVGSGLVVGVGSARQGLALILRTLALAAGDEVIMPAYTFHPLAFAVKSCGGKPVFVDVEAETYNIDHRLIEARINAKTRAILFTQMFGQPCRMDEILALARRHNLVVIEDCAHACGARYKGRRVGSIGDFAIFSFGMGKNLPCFGGGVVAVNNRDYFEPLRALSAQATSPRRRDLFKQVLATGAFFLATHKKVFPYLTYPLIRLLDFLNIGAVDESINEKTGECDLRAFAWLSRLANLQAAAGLSQLHRVETINRTMAENTGLLVAALRGCPELTLPVLEAGNESTHLYFRVKVERPREFRREMLRRGIDTKGDDMSDCTSLGSFADSAGSCPVAARLPGESIEIPCNLSLSPADVSYIAGQIKSCLAERRS